MIQMRWKENPGWRCAPLTVESWGKHYCLQFRESESVVPGKDGKAKGNRVKWSAWQWAMHRVDRDEPDDAEEEFIYDDSREGLMMRAAHEFAKDVERDVMAQFARKPDA